MAKTWKDSARLASLSPNAAEWEVKMQEERETLRRWREDVRAGRALPAAGDLLATVQPVPMPEPRPLSWQDRDARPNVPAWQPDLFGGDLFDGVKS